MLTVKVGGAAGIGFEGLVRDVARLWQAGTRMVLVHGGSNETNELSDRLGHPPRFVTSPSGYTSRYTDRTTVDIFTMACQGSVNASLVEQLQTAGVNCVGLSGMDGRTLVGRRKNTVRSVEEGRVKILRDDYTGTVDQVNSQLLTMLLDNGLLPVLGPPAISHEGVPLNVDADRAAAAVATALEADSLIILSNVPGLLAEYPDENSLVHDLPVTRIDEFMGLAEGRMRKKLLGAVEAVRGGVNRVLLGDARMDEPITCALAGYGTAVHAGVAAAP